VECSGKVGAVEGALHLIAARTAIRPEMRGCRHLRQPCAALRLRKHESEAAGIVLLHAEQVTDVAAAGRPAREQ